MFQQIGSVASTPNLEAKKQRHPFVWPTQAVEFRGWEEQLSWWIEATPQGDGFAPCNAYFLQGEWDLTCTLAAQARGQFFDGMVASEGQSLSAK